MSCSPCRQNTEVTRSFARFIVRDTGWRTAKSGGAIFTGSCSGTVSLIADAWPTMSAAETEYSSDATHTPTLAMSKFIGCHGSTLVNKEYIIYQRSDCAKLT